MSIAISATGSTLNPGAALHFTAKATYSDGSTPDVTTSTTWSSSSPAVATIQNTGDSNPGVAIGVSPGTTTITATLGEKTATTMITVNDTTLRALSVTPANPTVAVGATQQFVAKGTFSDSSTGDVTFTSKWLSSQEGIATIQGPGDPNPGLAKGVANGTSNIQAKFGSSTGLTILNVSTSGGTQVGLNLSEIDPSIAPGSTLQFIAVAVYDNNSKVNVDDTAQWSSSDPTKVSVVKGLVTGIAPTSAPVTVTASSGGETNSATVTVASNAVTKALMDMTPSDNYLGFQGGLYENSSDTVPADHDAAGLAAAAAIQPLDQNGNPSSSGTVVFLGIGMSNATLEFSAFKTAAEASSSVNHSTLAIEDGAYGSVTACSWTIANGPPTPVPCPGLTGVPAENQYDRVRDTVLATDTTAPNVPAGCGTTTSPCLTEKQVQVIWLKNANPNPGETSLGSLTSTTVCASALSLPIVPEACNYESQLGQTIRAAKTRYPNLKQVFLSTRIYAGYATTTLNPEPYAYEYGFSGKWLIQAQVDQTRSATIDPVAGDMGYAPGGKAAWTAWGPYLWADGLNPRSDGLVWDPSDFQVDGTHPDDQGTQKVVNLLMPFFTTSSYTPWFRP
jgi:uncharacterized protein YjdB